MKQYQLINIKYSTFIKMKMMDIKKTENTNKIGYTINTYFKNTTFSLMLFLKNIK